MPETCGTCGRALSAAAAFCPYCGTPLAEAGAENAAVSAELAGVGRLAPFLNADDLGDFTEKFFRTAERAARAAGGAVHREEGASLTVAFSSPPAAAAKGAAQCALALRAAVRELVATLPPAAAAKLTFKAGISGAAPTAAPFRDEPTARISARRLRGKAGDWTILANETVCSLTGEDFRYQPIGFYQARGGGHPLTIFQLEEARSAAVALPTAVIQDFFVPPAGLKGNLENFFAAVKGQRRQRNMLVTGGAGKGKTATLRLAARLAAEQGFRVYYATGFSRRRYQPFSAWAPIWREWIAPASEGVFYARTVAKGFAARDPKFEIWAPLFAKVMGTEVRSNRHVEGVAPAFRHRRLTEIARAILHYEATQTPVAVIFDDPLRGDRASQAFLTSLFPRIDHPLALVYSAEAPEAGLAANADDVVATRVLTAAEINAGLGGVDGIDPALLAELSRGEPAKLKALWLLARERPDDLTVPWEEYPPSTEALLTHRLQDFPPSWRLATAALARLGVPATADEAAVLGREYGLAPTAVGGWFEAMRGGAMISPYPEAGGERWFIEPYAAAFLTELILATPEAAKRAAAAGARLLAEYLPHEESARFLLELEAGNVAAAADQAIAGARASLWLGVPADAADQITAVIRELESEGGEDAKKKTLLADLYLERAEAFAQSALAAAALADLDRADEIGDDAKSGLRALRRGEIFIHRGLYDDAAKELARALPDPAAGGDAGLAASVYMARAALLRRRGDADGAAAAVLSALDAGVEQPAVAYSVLSEIKFQAGRVAEAAEEARRGAAALDAARDPVAAAEMRLSWARIEFETGRVVQARRDLENSRRTFELLGDTVKYCDALIAEARIAIPTRPLAESRGVLAEALRVAEAEAYEPGIFAAATGMAVVALWEDDAKEVGRWIAQAQKASDIMSPPPSAELKWLEANVAYYARRAYDEATLMAHAAAEDYLRVGNVAGYTDAVVLASQAALARENADAARRDLFRRELTRRAQESKYFFARYGLVLAALCRLEGDQPKANHYLRAAAAAARELGLWFDGAAAHAEMAQSADKKTARDAHRRRALWIMKQNGARLMPPHA